MKKISSWSALTAGGMVVAGLLMSAGVALATVPTLNEYNVTVGLGQTATITAQNGVSLYIGANSNTAAATIAVNGTQMMVKGLAPGSTSVQVCTVGTASDCTTLTVTVQTTAVTGITFNPSSLSMTAGASQSVTITGGNGTYSLSGNSNTTIASTNFSGSTLTVNAVAAGSATITVCDTSNVCGTLSVTVNAAASSGGISFSQNNLSLTTGGSQVVTISGGNGVYNATGNSNSGVVSTSVSGNAITMYAITAGNATITVCDTSNVCGTLSVTVASNSSSSTNAGSNPIVSFSVTNPTLTIGQNLNIALTGVGASTGYIVLTNSDGNVAVANITNGTTLALTGEGNGTDLVTVCAVGGAGCGTLTATVGSQTTTTVATTTSTAAATTPPVTQTVSAPVSGTVVANGALLSEIQSLQNVVTQILSQLQSVQTQLNQLETQVNAGSGSISTTVNASTGSSGTFTELLTIGSQDAQVTALQRRLISLGFLSGSATGYYGSLTEQAVMKYQTAHGIAATGSVGPATRTALNTGN